MLDRPPLSGAPGAGLNFIGHQHDSVLVTDTSQFAQELRWCGDVTPFSLDRFDKDRRDVLGRHRGLEQALFDELCAGQTVFAFAFSFTETIGVWIRNMCHAGDKRSKASTLLRLRS